EVAVDPVRVALHVERPAPEVGEDTARDVEVVGDEAALRKAARREEELVRVRDRDVVRADAHPVYPRRNAVCGPRARPRRARGAPGGARPPRARAARVGPGAGGGRASLTRVNPGVLTVGPDTPASPPWYGGDAGHGWKVSDPTSGKGYESAVAYAVAKQLGFAPAQVKWTYVPFNRSFDPGKKSFDFDINQISYSPARLKVVTLQRCYL